MPLSLSIILLLAFLLMSAIFRLNPIEFLVEVFMYFKTVISRVIFTLKKFDRRKKSRTQTIRCRGVK